MAMASQRGVPRLPPRRRGMHRPRRSGYRALMSTDDQKRASELHGEAHKAARDQVPQEVLDRPAAAADRRDDLRVRTAGEITGLVMLRQTSPWGGTWRQNRGVRPR